MLYLDSYSMHRLTKAKGLIVKEICETLSEYDFIMPKIIDGWNASMFYILTPNPKRSRQLKKLLNEQKELGTGSLPDH